jgi:pilus assembly protein CpaC
MKPARSIVPAIDHTVEKANGQRVVAIGSAAPLAAGASIRHPGIDAARPGRGATNRKPAACSDDKSGRPSLGDVACFRSTTMSAAKPRVPTRDRNMARTTLIRITSRAALITTLGIVAIGPASAGDQRAVDAGAQGIDVVGSDLNSRFIPLGVGKSVVIDLPRDIKDVLIADPKIANAVIRSARRAYIIGAAVGQTNIFFFDAEGRQIGGFDIAVKRDLNGIRSALKQALPASEILVEAVGDGVLLSGNVATSAEAQIAFDVAARLLGAGTNPITGEGSKVVNAITVHGHDQVMLKITVAEMQRTVIKQLGIDLNGSFGVGPAVVGFSNQNPFTTTPVLNAATGLGGTFKSVTATLRAMEQAGVVHTLAEPTLTAISGESASFLAGGEFPIPPPVQVGPTTTPAQPSFKQFGVALSFTPVVLSEGRISLNVKTEVSEIDPSLTVLGVPGVKTRRAETTLEVPSGGSLAMAGMIQDQTKQNINGFPGLMQLPVLGALFKSRDYQNSQTELVILVTPYVVRAVAQKGLSRPDDGFADASDPATVLLGNLNRIYGVPGNADTKRPYRGNYGFILD